MRSVFIASLVCAASIGCASTEAHSPPVEGAPKIVSVGTALVGEAFAGCSLSIRSGCGIALPSRTPLSPARGATPGVDGLKASRLLAGSQLLQAATSAAALGLPAQYDWDEAMALPAVPGPAAALPFLMGVLLAARKRRARSAGIDDRPKLLIDRLDVDIDRAPVTPGYRLVKRALDVVVSGTMLLLLFPLFALVGVLVFLTSPGPICYESTRIGLCGRPFRFLKFRSMRRNADRIRENLEEANEKDGPIFKMRRDPRITPIGRILRKFSIDELPQLIHVLKGEMTLVGPRPPLPSEVLQYEEEWLGRLSVKPGLTCFWQIQGRSDLSFEEWMELDLKYVRERNLWLDLKILAKTPAAVLFGKGAY
jgi:lipopolysaccharide/colanic/teichoic acid biosynthesis glycosyltransferase